MLWHQRAGFSTDMRNGTGGLAAAAQEVPKQNPCSGGIFAFRGHRRDRLKLLTWDGQRFCLCFKVLEHARLR
ncbi:MAG: IS66 family insertion sequence element accessory protein TnpB [Pseudomonadota bacterium]